MWRAIKPKVIIKGPITTYSNGRNTKSIKLTVGAEPITSSIFEETNFSGVFYDIEEIRNAVECETPHLKHWIEIQQTSGYMAWAKASRVIVDSDYMGNLLAPYYLYKSELIRPLLLPAVTFEVYWVTISDPIPDHEIAWQIYDCHTNSVELRRSSAYDDLLMAYAIKINDRSGASMNCMSSEYDVNEVKYVMASPESVGVDVQIQGIGDVMIYPNTFVRFNMTLKHASAISSIRLRSSASRAGMDVTWVYDPITGVCSVSVGNLTNSNVFLDSDDLRVFTLVYKENVLSAWPKWYLLEKDLSLQHLTDIPYVGPGAKKWQEIDHALFGKATVKTKGLKALKAQDIDSSLRKPIFFKCDNSSHIVALNKLFHKYIFFTTVSIPDDGIGIELVDLITAKVKDECASNTVLLSERGNNLNEIIGFLEYIIINYKSY